ncbi:MAG: aminoglycoside phosphotransferase family protein [Puniceicoccales bacterium]|jgi:Ser/Thr protein kinase RdoA (MazF antagonist)|nr:aminoglycoside phosphotransferase family protein [Puniceicoccales bacterium]
MSFDLRAIATNFDILGDYISAKPYGSGHINDTFSAMYNQGGARVRYIVQRVNHVVFKNPVALLQNVSRVCRHLRGKLRAAGVRDASRRALTLVPTYSGEEWFRDDDGNYWRCYILIEGVTAYDVVGHEAQAFAVAKAFGNFTNLLTDLGGGRLADVIPDFHNTPWRFANFQKALAADAHNRAADVRDEIAFVLAREKDCAIVTDALVRGDIPERVTHNDTKLNNVLIDEFTEAGMCVIDLDTVMPGSALYDFGDMVRTTAAAAKEDETDLSKVACRQGYFEALVRGYTESLGDSLTQTEKDLLAFSGKLMTFEVGLRFLTDYLEGDTYFKVAHPRHNLDRCRNQFAMVRSIEAQLDAMNAFVAKA